MSKLKYVNGQKLGNSTYIRELEPLITPSGRAMRRAEFKCSFCGNSFITCIKNVKSGDTKSCGCQGARIKIKFLNMTHNKTKHPLFDVWRSMKQRCNNPKATGYIYYGYRGISVCKEWRNFESFYDWAQNNGYKKGLQIDRIDTNGNYAPSNCRFVSSKINNRNRRNVEVTENIATEIRNAKLLIPTIKVKELALAFNINYRTTLNILNNKTWL